MADKKGESILSKGMSFILTITTGDVPVKSKLQHPPRATPRVFELLENFCSNSPPPEAEKLSVQMPHHRSIPGYQMPPTPGNFSVVFIMLRKLCM